MFERCLMVTGFPRNLKQAEALHHGETTPDIVVDLQVPFEVIIDRISKRWIHEPSGRVYNLDFNKPKVPVSCSQCCVFHEYVNMSMNVNRVVNFRKY